MALDRTVIERTDVLIAGGGFAGLALAIALSQVSDGELSVTVADAGPLTLIDPHAADPARADPRASALAGGSIKMLETLGVWSSLAPNAQVVGGIDLTDSSLAAGIRPVLLSYDPTLPDGTPGMSIVENGHLRAALLAAAMAAPGVRLAPLTRIESTTVARSWIAATTSLGQTIRASLVVSAEGRRSSLRAAAGIRGTHHAYDQTGIVTKVRLDQPHHGRALQHFLPGGPFALLPLPGDFACITWSERTDVATALLAADASTLTNAINERLGGRWGPAHLVGPCRSWPLEVFLARELTAPRLVLVGDSARSVHPIAGQGLNLGFRDVAALTEVIVDAARTGQDIGSPVVLEAYQQRRRMDGVSSAAAFDLINRLFSNDWAVLRTARDAGLGVVDRLPVLKRWLVGEAAGETGDVPLLLQGLRP